MAPTMRSPTTRSGQSPPSKRAKISKSNDKVEATGSAANNTNEPSEENPEVSTSATEEDNVTSVEPWRMPEANDIRHFNIPGAEGKKAIVCEHHYDNGTEAAPTEDTAQLTAEQLESTRLIFTHGAGGGIKAAATRDFAVGFSSLSPVTCFEGSMNLKSRVGGFNDVLRHHSTSQQADIPADTPSVTYPALGGRSMGARAAVICAQKDRDASSTENSSRSAGPSPAPRPLVLVSYPLNPPGKQQSATDIAMRRGILLSIPEGTPVLLIVGSRDEYCSVKDLHGLVQEMKAQVWAVVVYAVDHGMNVVPSALQKVMSKKDREEGEAALRRETGKYAALWLEYRAEEHTNYQEQPNLDRIELMWWDWHKKAIIRTDAKDSLRLLDGL